MTFKEKIIIVGIFSIGCYYAYIYYTNQPKHEYVPNTVSWYESKVQINYQNGDVDTVDIDVYENLDNVEIIDGNMSYVKATKATGGVVAYKVKLSSYVRSFKIIKSEFKMKQG